MHTVEYYSTIKRDEVLLHATTWINLEKMLRSQSQKITYSVIPFIRNVQDRQIQRDKVD